jgi:hypothetical protein
MNLRRKEIPRSTLTRVVRTLPGIDGYTLPKPSDIEEVDVDTVKAECEITDNRREAA